jgi:uncharacterized delta-60 repeat protein
MKIENAEQYLETTMITAVTVLVISVACALTSFAQNKLDPKFGNGGQVRTNIDRVDAAFAVVLQPDGKIVAAGASAVSNNDFGTDNMAIARYNGDGNLDATFGDAGKLVIDLGGFDDLYAVALQPDGKIVAAGASSGDFVIIRCTANGVQDPTFGNGGIVITFLSGSYDAAEALLIQPDGKILAAGITGASSPDFGLVRYNSDGSLDTTFGSGGIVTTDFNGYYDQAQAIVLQTDGKIIAAGNTNGPSYVGFALARYGSNGSLDPTFGNGGKVITNINREYGAYALILQPDGKLVAAGHSLARYRPDGTLDATFGSNGVATGAFYFSALVRESNGKLIAAGEDLNSDFGLERFNSDGLVDSTFGTAGRIVTDFGADDRARGVVIQPNGKIVAAGFSISADGTVGDFALARYAASPSLPINTGDLPEN